MVLSESEIYPQRKQDLTPAQGGFVSSVSNSLATICNQSGISPLKRKNKEKEIEEKGGGEKEKRSAAPSPTGLALCLNSLIQKFHPHVPAVNGDILAIRIQRHAQVMQDLEEAKEVIEWAFYDSERWSNGKHWSDILISADKVLEKYPVLLNQYRQALSRKHQATEGYLPRKRREEVEPLDFLVINAETFFDSEEGEDDGENTKPSIG
jgi:hypothetical protein